MMDLDVAIKQYHAASADIDANVKRDVPKGKILTWKDGPYKGRRCEVRETLWEVNHKGEFLVYVQVATYRVTSKGRELTGRFIDDNDSFHRTFHDSYRMFEEI